MRIVVAEARAPGAHDGAELQVEPLMADLRQRGHDVEGVVLPFRGMPHTVRDEAAAWRLLDLSVAGGRPVDLLIATGFPAYFARHPRKVAWLVRSPAVPADLTALDSRIRQECVRIVTATLYDSRLVEQLLG